MNGGDAKGFGIVGGEVCPVLDGGCVVNGGAVIIFWDIDFVGVLLGDAGGLGRERSMQWRCRIERRRWVCFVVGFLRLLRGVCLVGFVGLLFSGNGGEGSSIVVEDTEDIVGLTCRTNEGDGIEVCGAGEGNLAIWRSVFLSEA